MYAKCATGAVVTVVTVMLTGSLCEGQIVFLQEPKNVTVAEGKDAFFPCSYNGTNRSPSWTINNHVFLSSSPPPKHSYNGSGLIVSNVDSSLNMSSYSCFIVSVTRGQLINTKSNTGFLLIAADRISPTSPEFAQCGSNTGHLASPSITFALQFSPIEHDYYTVTSTTTTNSLYVHWPTMSATPHKNFRQMRISTLLVGGICAGVTIICLVCVLAITCLCFIIIRQRRQNPEKPTISDPIYDQPEEFKLQEVRMVPTEPEYEQPTTLCKLQENIAYKVPPSWIKTAENEAYGAVSSGDD